MIRSDGGLVSSEAQIVELIVASGAFLFALHFFSLGPTVLGLSCSLSKWNVSPARCWEDLFGAQPHLPVIPLSFSQSCRLIKMFPPLFSSLFITLLFFLSFFPRSYIFPPLLPGFF